MSERKRLKGWLIDFLVMMGGVFRFFRNTTFLSIQFWNFTCHSFLYSILLSLSISISYFFYYNNTWISSENSNERKSPLHLTYSYIYYLVILIITQLPPPQLHHLDPHSQNPKPSSNSSMQIYKIHLFINPITTTYFTSTLSTMRKAYSLHLGFS